MRLFEEIVRVWDTKEKFRKQIDLYFFSCINDQIFCSLLIFSLPFDHSFIHSFVYIHSCSRKMEFKDKESAQKKKTAAFFFSRNGIDHILIPKTYMCLHALMKIGFHIPSKKYIYIGFEDYEFQTSNQLLKWNTTL